MKKYKDISRVDIESNNTHGWNLRVCSQGKMTCKYFSDKKNGGREAALQATREYRKQLCADLGKPESERYVVTVPRSNTGVVGVWRDKKNKCLVITWTTSEGKQRKTSVSIRKYGFQDALLRAYRIRQQKNAERLAV